MAYNTHLLPLGDPAYRRIDLQKQPDNRALIVPEFKRHVFLELGRNVVQLARFVDIPGIPPGQQRPPQRYSFTNMAYRPHMQDPSQLTVISVNSTQEAPHLVVGRETTPNLYFDNSASRRHFALVAGAHALELIDIHSTSSTIVHAHRYDLLPPPVQMPANPRR